MAKSKPDLFYKTSQSRGVLVCREWSRFIFHELKAATVRLLGPPIRSHAGRYAIHCIDRSDEKMKVLEGPYDLFVQFAAYAKVNGRNPSGPEAPDFRIALTPRPWRYFATPLSLTTLSNQEQIDTVGYTLNLGQIYKSGTDMHILDVTARLGLWPKPVWPTKYQEMANAADPERLAAEGIILRFPSRKELH